MVGVDGGTLCRVQVAGRAIQGMPVDFHARSIRAVGASSQNQEAGHDQQGEDSCQHGVRSQPNNKVGEYNGFIAKGKFFLAPVHFPVLLSLDHSPGGAGMISSFGCLMGSSSFTKIRIQIGRVIMLRSLFILLSVLSVSLFLQEVFHWLPRRRLPWVKQNCWLPRLP